MKEQLKLLWGMLKRAVSNWLQNEPWGQSATIAYYAVFSLPSLLIIVVSTAGYFFGKEAVQGEVTRQIARFIGEDLADVIETIIINAALDANSTLTFIFGIGTLLFGATGVFYHIKMAMNNIWNVTAKEKTFLRMTINRVISFGMVLVLGFLLLVSMVISALMTAFSGYLSSLAPGFTVFMVQIANFLISFFFIVALFAAIFKLLPDVVLKWKTTFLGAALTTFLFLIGQFLMTYYFETSNPGLVYGSASALVIFLLWVYYTALILFFGVEFTVQYAVHKREKIVPNKYAEPAIYQELERIKKKSGQTLQQERIMDILGYEKKKSQNSENQE